MAQKLTLVSHTLCPYVQRAAIVLAEKHLAFERIDIDLGHKPDWFLQVSPLGKTPVLLVDGTPIFESAVICEYVDEVTPHPLHPADPLARAQHRGWMEFGSALLNTIGAFYSAPTDSALAAQATEIRRKLEQVERALDAAPYFAGAHFSMVDAVFGPVFRYFDVFDAVEGLAFFTHTPKVRAWRAALAARPSVRQAVRADYADLLRDFLAQRPSALGQRVKAMRDAQEEGAPRGAQVRSETPC